MHNCRSHFLRASIFTPLLAILLAPSLTADRDRTDPGIRKLYTFWQARTERLNGARLRITVSVANTREGDELRVNWSVDYDGPRPPLIMLAPTLSAQAGQTSIKIFAEIPGREPALCEIQSLSLRGPPLPSTKKSFCTATVGKPATGMIAISLAKIRECFQKEVPGQFGTTPPLLHVLLYHRTHDRGEHLSLDAWTGDLHAGPVRHKLKDW